MDWLCGECRKPVELKKGSLVYWYSCPADGRHFYPKGWAPEGENPVDTH